MQELYDKTQNMLQAIQAFESNDAAQIEQFRIEYLGTKGSVKALLAELKNVPNELKREFGQLANAVKQAAEKRYAELKSQAVETENNANSINDLSLPIGNHTLGSRHPVAIVIKQIGQIFERMGFAIAEGNEIEDDWHNFTALNTPEDHPSRDMQDTFYISQNPVRVLRSQTSTVQVHAMEQQKPPIRIISPGRVYRNETISARAHCQFHQIEGLYIAENVSFADLRHCLLHFAREFFGQNTRIRLRPSYFPFTEPSAEMDVSCFICNAKGCPVCKHSGWVEILGCGMVDPQVLQNCGIDPEKYSGYAFGMGIERMVMLKYRVNDIRLMFENDVRFLRQFAGTC